MITLGSRFRIERIPLGYLRVTEYQKRYSERVQHYVDLLQANPHDAPGFILVKPTLSEPPMYEILDGHHRFVAHVIAGREHALCIIIQEPENEPPTDDQRALEELRAKLSAPPRTYAGQAGSCDLSEETRRESAYQWQQQFTSELAEHWQNSENRAIVRGDDTQLGHILDRLL